MLRNDQNQNLPAIIMIIVNLFSPWPRLIPLSLPHLLTTSYMVLNTCTRPRLVPGGLGGLAGEEQRVRSTYIYLHPWYGNLFSHQRCCTFTDKDRRSLIANSMLGFLEGALGLFSTFILSRVQTVSRTSPGPLL